MAAASDIDPKEVEVTIKGLLISRPTVANANLLLRECQDELGIQYFFRKLGFQTFIDYLRSIPHVVLLEPPNSSNPNVYPVASKASKHIDELVSRQRVPTSRKRGVSRRGAYNSRPPPIKRRPIRPPQPVSRPSGLAARPNQHTSSFQSREFRSQAFPSSSSSFFPSGLKNGIEVRELERHLTRNYDQRDLERNGIHNVNDLLSRAENMVERCDTKVYPKLAGNNNSYGSGEVKCIPAGLEDDFDDCDDDFFDYEYYSEEDEKDSEEELSNKAIKLWSKALGEENNGSSSRSPVPRDETPNVTVKKKEELDHNGDLPENEINISNGMIINFRKILSQNPNGIWASQLQNLYSDQFDVPLDLSDLGYPSVISLVSSLPSVFSYCREGTSDWRLFDARYITQDFLDNQQSRKDALLPENERYIPQTIIENIKRLLDNHPDGFRSPDLLSLYEETFNKPLNLEILGFDTLNEFLMILKNDITLKKVFNYYLLLPKHKLVSHEALQPPRPDERLNIPADVLGLPVPEGMMRLGDEIPLQELPPVEMDPDPDRPLLELEVRVAEVISPSFFYMILGEKYQQLENMMDDLHKFYSWEEEKLKIPLPLIAMNLYCAARYGPDQYWHRVKVTRIQRDGKIEIEYIDYGTPGTVESSQLRYLSKEFSHFPAQAICGKLIGVKPLNGTKHGKDACEHFLDLVSGKRLLAYVYQIVERVRLRQERMQLEMILFDVENPDQEIVINDYLIEKGLVCSIHQVQDSSTDDQSSTKTQPEDGCPAVQDSGLPVSPANAITTMENVASYLLPTNSATSHPASSKTLEVSSRTLGPPPGFKLLLNHPGKPIDDSFTPTVSAAQTQSLEHLLSHGDSQCTPLDMENNPLLSSLSKPIDDSLTPIVSAAQTNSLEDLLSSGDSQNTSLDMGNNDILNTPAIDLTTTAASNTLPQSTQSTSSNPQPTPKLSHEDQQILINNFYLMDSSSMMPQLMLQEQYCSNIYQPNPSNMPLNGPPLFQSNGNQRSLQYSTILPPQNAHYNPTTSMYKQTEYRVGPVPSSYVQVPIAPYAVPYVPVHQPGFIVMNTPVPNQYPQLYPPPQQLRHPVANLRMQGRVMLSSPVQVVQSRPVLINPNTPRPKSSAPAYTPITVPEWPSANLTATFTSAPAETKVVSCSQQSLPAQQKISELPQSNQISRPCTPLTPASAEVANICKLSRPNSSASLNSGSQSANSQNNPSPTNNIFSKSPATKSLLEDLSSTLHNSKGPLNTTSNVSQRNTIIVDNTSYEAQNETQDISDYFKNNTGLFNDSSNNSPTFKSAFENTKKTFKIENFKCNFVDHVDPILDIAGYPEQEGIAEIPLPPAIKIKEIPLPSPSPEKLYSAFSSPVDSLIRNSPLKEESSDDCVSASENVEETKQSMAKLTLTEHHSFPALNSPCDTSEYIPDSWENLDLDETPAKSANFSVDFSQPLDLIIKNMENKSFLNTDKKSEVELNQECPLRILAPTNWKDINPDIFSTSESVDNNNKVSKNPTSNMKFNVKKIPLQKIEVQGKYFHLLYLVNKPAVIALEFLSLFVTSSSPTVMEKILEVKCPRLYYINKMEHPAILNELNKVDEFGKDLARKTVIRLNKVKVLNLSDIPDILSALNISNKLLLDDIQKIANELESS